MGEGRRQGCGASPSRRRFPSPHLLQGSWWTLLHPKSHRQEEGMARVFSQGLLPHMRTQGPGTRNSSAKPEEGSRSQGVLRVDRKACAGAGEPGARPGPLAESFLGLCWDRPLGAGQDTDTRGLSWEKQGGRELPSQFYGFCFQGEGP